MDNNIEEKNVTKDISDLHSKLKDLLGQIQKNDIGNENPWGGAGVIITKGDFAEEDALGDDNIITEDDAPSDDVDSWRSPAIYIETPFDTELSWLFCRLWEMFQKYLDYISKYEFFERLAKASNHYMDTNTIITPIDLLTATVEEAISIAYDIQNGDFNT